MSFRDSHSRHDSRRRAKNAGNYRSSHHDAASDLSQDHFEPIDPDAIALRSKKVIPGNSGHIQDEEKYQPMHELVLDQSKNDRAKSSERKNAASSASDDAFVNVDTKNIEPDSVGDAFAPAMATIPSIPAQETSQYSRNDAHYTHRSAWASFSSGQRLALIIVAVVFCMLCAAGGAAFALYQQYQSNIELTDSSIKDALEQTTDTEPSWTLILGSDSRTTSTTGTNSDVIMLARVDQANKKVTLVSIPRDTKIYLNGQVQKINAAYAYGGAKLAISTVEDFAGVNISHYVEVYFKGFEKLVDKIGGVDVDVPEYASYHGVTIKPGHRHLNGKKALTLARNRKTYATGDFRRTQCQRLLVQAVAEKILSQDATQIPTILEALTQCFSTDMELTDIISLASSMQGMSSDSFLSGMAPSTTGMIGSLSYTFTYINQWKLIMQRAVDGQEPTVNKKEQAICGYISTATDDLDMSEDIPKKIQKKLQKYWDAKAQRAAEKEQAEQEAAAQGNADTAGTITASSSSSE